MKAKLRETGEVVELRQYYCDGTAKVLMENITIKVTYLSCLKISIIKD